MTPLLAGSGMPMLLLIAVAFILITTLAQRPVKKQAQRQAEMRNSVAEGTRVMLTSGLFGTVTHVGTSQVIVELAPGVEVTAMKDAINKVVAPEDEEFEFADSGNTLDVAGEDDPQVEETGPVAAWEPAADQGAVTSHGASAPPAPVTHEGTTDDSEPASDAATMTNAEPGTEQGLGYPEHPGR